MILTPFFKPDAELHCFQNLRAPLVVSHAFHIICHNPSLLVFLLQLINSIQKQHTHDYKDPKQVLLSPLFRQSQNKHGLPR